MAELNTLLSLVKGGNIALGEKISNLLTDDCVVLEYTDQKILFTKGSKLVLATFKTPLAEESITADHILDNVVLEMSVKDIQGHLRAELGKLVECVANENFTDAGEHLEKFCEEFYQLNALKLRCPEAFVEMKAPVVRKSAQLHKEAEASVDKFKKEVFKLALDSDVEDARIFGIDSVFESAGKVLVLGKAKVAALVEDSTLGNKELAEALVENIYRTLNERLDEDGDFKALKDDGYDFEAGSYADEDEGGLPDVATESDMDEDDSVKPFEEFDPSKLSTEETQFLHRTILTSILNDIKTFVMEKSHDITNTDIPADLDEQLDADLDSLNDDDISSSRLAEIEAKWNPIISYFLDSETHTPDEEFEALEDETPLDETLPPSDEADTGIDQVETGDAAPLPGGEVPGEELPPVNPEEEIK